MDGFRERLNGRYDRSQMRGSGYDRMSGEDRYEGDRYERPSRRPAPESVSQEAISEAVNEAIAKSNREQLDVIADFFDEAKADRMESERAIIDALSHGLNEVTAAAKENVAPAPAPAPAPEIKEPISVMDEQTSETLARIERIAGQNAESLNESSEMLERNIDSLRSNTELLNEIKNSVGSLLSSSEEIKSASSGMSESLRQGLSEISQRSAAPVAAPMQDITVDFTAEKNEIIGAVGDNRAILNMIRQDVLNGFARNASEDENAAKAPAFSAEDADRYYKELEEHVHKECVKCYRNVQSALVEQNTEAGNAIEKSVSGMRIMVLLSLLFSLASLALLALYIFGILPL